MPTVCPGCGFNGDPPADAPQGAPASAPAGAPSPYSSSPYGGSGGYGTTSPYGAASSGYTPPASPTPQPPEQVPPGQQYGQVQPTNGMAVAALVLGLVGLCAWFIAPILAIIFGVIGRNQCRARNEKGEGMAVTGIVLGSVSLTLTVLGYLFMFTFWIPFLEEWVALLGGHP